MAVGRVPGRPGAGGSSLTLTASQLAGRGSASGSGSPEAITLGTNLTMSGTTLNANAGSGAPSGAQYVVLALDAGLSAERRLQIEAAVLSLTDGGVNGDVTIGVATNGIANTKLAQMAARTIKANNTNGTANAADLAGGGAGTVLQDTGTALVVQALTRILQNVSLEGDVTPAQLTANTDNWNPKATASVVRFSTDANGREIRGLVPSTNDGDIAVLINVGSFTGIIKQEQATSTATNRFVTADTTVGANEVAFCWHDPNEDTGVGRWRVILKLLTLGTAAHQACAGNDSRLSDSRAPNGSAGGSLSGSYPDPGIAAGAVGGTEIAAAIKDPAAGTPGLRTLSNTGTTACAGNDARLSDTRTPTDATVTPAKFHSTAIDPVAGTAGARTLGTGGQQACAGNDSRLSDTRTPTDATVTPAKFHSSAIDPAAGTAGARTLGTGAQTACAGNDSRLSDTRTPTNGSVTEAKLATVVGNVVFALTDGANVAVNRDNGKNQKLTLTGNGHIIDAPTGTLIDGMFLIFAIRQDATGSRTGITFASGAGGFRATGGCSLTPTLSTGANKTDYVVARYVEADTKWDLVQLTLAA